MARLTLEKTKDCYLPGDPDGAMVRIRLLDDDEVAKIEARAVRNTLNKQGGVIELNSVEREDGIAEACLVYWEGWFGPTGKPIKHTKKNLVDMRRFSVVGEDGKKQRFMKWVDEQHTIFREEVEAEEENASKN